MTLMRDCGCNPELPFPAAVIHKSQLVSILKLLICRSSRKEWLRQVIADFDAYNTCECESCHVVIGVDPPVMRHCLCCSPEHNDRSPDEEGAAACFTRNPGASSIDHLNAAVQTMAPEAEWFDDFVHLPIFQQLKLMLICIKQLLLRKQHLTGSLTHKEHNIYCRVYAEICYLCKNEQQLCRKPVPESAHSQLNSVDSDDQVQGMGHYFHQLTATHCNTFAVLQQFIPEVLLEALSCLLQNSSEREPHETISCTSRVSIDYWTCDHKYKLCLYDSGGCRLAFYSMLGSESSTIDAWEQNSLVNCFKKVELYDTGISDEGLLESSAKIINEVLAPPWLSMLYKYYEQLSSLDQFMEEEDRLLPDWDACKTEDLSTMYRAWSLSNSNREVIKYLVRAMHHYMSIESEMRRTCPMFVNSSCVQDSVLHTVCALKNLEQVPFTLWSQRVVQLVCDLNKQRTATGTTNQCHPLRGKGKHFTLSLSGKLLPAVSYQQEFSMLASSRLNKDYKKVKASSKAASCISLGLPWKSELLLPSQVSDHLDPDQIFRSELSAKVKRSASGSCPSWSRRRKSGKILSSSLSLDEIRSSSSKRLSSRSVVRQWSSSSSSSSGEIGSTSDDSGSSSSSDTVTESSPSSSSTSSSSTFISSFDSFKQRKSHCRHHGKIRSDYRLMKKYMAIARSSRQKSSVNDYSLPAYDSISSGEITSPSNEYESSSSSEALTMSSSPRSSSSTLSCHGSVPFCDSATYRRLYSRSRQKIRSVQRHSSRSTSSRRRRVRAKEHSASAYGSRSLRKHDKRKEVSQRHSGGSWSNDRTIPKKHSHKERRDILEINSKSSSRNTPTEHLELVMSAMMSQHGFNERCSEEQKPKTEAAMLASNHLENITSENKSDISSSRTAEPLLVKINTKMELDVVDSFVGSSKDSDYDFYIDHLGIDLSYLGTKESLEFVDLWQTSIFDCRDRQGCAMEEEPNIPPAAVAIEDQGVGDDATVLDVPREQDMTREPQNKKAKQLIKGKLLQKCSHRKAALRRVKLLPPCVRCHHVMAKAVTSFCGSSSAKNKTTAFQNSSALGSLRHMLGRRFCHKCHRVKKSQMFSASIKAKMEGMPLGSKCTKRSCDEAMRTEELLNKGDVSVLSASHPAVASCSVDSCPTAVNHSNDLQASYSWSETKNKKVASTSNIDWLYECKMTSTLLTSHQSGFNNNEQSDNNLSLATISSSQMLIEDTHRMSNVMQKSTQDHLAPNDDHLKLVQHHPEPVLSDMVSAEHCAEYCAEPVKCSVKPPDRDLLEITGESCIHSDCGRMKQVEPTANGVKPGTSCQKPVTSAEGMEEADREIVHPSAESLANGSNIVKASHVDKQLSVANNEVAPQPSDDNGDEERHDKNVGNESMQHDGNREMEQDDDANVICFDGGGQYSKTSQQVTSMHVEPYDMAVEVGGTAEESSHIALELNDVDLETNDVALKVDGMPVEATGNAAMAVDTTAECSDTIVEHNDLSPKPDERSVDVVKRDRKPSTDETGLVSLTSSDVSPHHKQHELLDQGINLPDITEPNLCFNDSSYMLVCSDTEDDEGDLPAVLMTRNSQTSVAPEHDQQEASDSQVNQKNEAHHMPVLHSGNGEKKMADLRIMLDYMLTEKINKLEDNRKLAAQVDELNEDLRKGGINKFSLEDLTEVEETELLPEHKAKLKQFEIQNCQISGEAPGLHLFDCTKVQCLFSFPTMLTLSMCGFVPGRSSLDKMLATADPDCITELLNSQMIQMCFESLSCPDVFMDWLFFLLSDDTGELVSCSSLKTLLDLLQQDHGKSSHWIPTPLTLARVLVNYGASLSMLLPVDNLVDFTDSDLSLTNNKENSQPDNNPVLGQMLPPTGQWCYYDNLRRVLRVLAEAIHKRSHLYSVKDLLAITVMLLRVSIDQNLNNNCLMHDLKLCMSAILNAIPQEKWNSYISQLCQIAPQLASHHHNLLQLVEVLPPSERGITLQHHLAYVFLHYLSFGDYKQDFMDLKIRDLLPIVKSFQVGEGTDFYRLYSLCVLLDRCISKKTLPVSEKADLKVLCDMLKCLMGSVRECITDLDRSVVKELLTQLISILSIKLESMGFRQRTLFEYCLPPPQERTSLAVDQIEDNQSDDDDISDSQSEVSRPCE